MIVLIYVEKIAKQHAVKTALQTADILAMEFVMMTACLHVKVDAKVVVEGHAGLHVWAIVQLVAMEPQHFFNDIWKSKIM